MASGTMVRERQEISATLYSHRIVQTAVVAGSLETSAPNIRTSLLHPSVDPRGHRRVRSRDFEMDEAPRRLPSAPLR